MKGRWWQVSKAGDRWWLHGYTDGLSLPRLRLEPWDEGDVALRFEIGVTGADPFFSCGVQVRWPWLQGWLLDREGRP